MSEPHGFCRWCTGFLFTLGLAALLLWLSYRPLQPRYFLVALQLSPIANRTAVAAPGGGGGNATLNFTLEVENKNKHMGVYYDPFNVSLSYGNRSVSATIRGFHQGHGKTADKVGKAGVSWGAAAREAVAKGTAVLRVGVVTGYRYKVLLWTGRRHRVSVGADVEVNEEGGKKAEKGIWLRSSGAPLVMGARQAPAVAAAVLVVVLAGAVPPPLTLF